MQITGAVFNSGNSLYRGPTLYQRWLARQLLRRKFHKYSSACILSLSVHMIVRKHFLTGDWVRGCLPGAKGKG